MSEDELTGSGSGRVVITDDCDGWRAWGIDMDIAAWESPRLRSVSHNYEWVPRKILRAACSKCKEVPTLSCGCGFYSAKSLKHLKSMGYHSYGEYNATIVGRVANWGKVIECQSGWRSEFSYPRVLYVPYEYWKIAPRLKRGYGVPVQLLNFLKPTVLAQVGE